MCRRSPGSSRTPTANIGEAKRFSGAGEGRIMLAELRSEPEMHARLVPNLDHASQRLIKSGSHSTNYRILSLV